MPLRRTAASVPSLPDASRAIAAALVMALAVTIAWILTPAGVSAHATLVRADPPANSVLRESPSRIALAFAEPIDNRTIELRVLRADGGAVAIGPVEPAGGGFAATLPPLPPGIYNVIWANVSRSDGHALRGSYPFTVLSPDGTVPDVVNVVSGLGAGTDPEPDWDSVAVRALALVGLTIAAAAGMIAVLLGALAPAVARSLRRLATAGGALIMAAAVLEFVLLRRTYPDLGLSTLILHTRPGGLWLARSSAVLVLAALLPFIETSPRRAGAASLGTVAVCLFSYSVTSHASAGSGSYWAIPLDLGHGLAAVGWMSAVAGIAVVARVAARETRLLVLVPRFSLTASVLVAALLTSGLMSSLIEIDRFTALRDTRYGVTLAIKLGGTALLLGLAAVNALRARRFAAESALPRHFLPAAAAELLLGVAVFAAAAALTQTTTSKTVTPGPPDDAYVQSVEQGDVRIELTITPNRVAIATFTVRVLDRSGERALADSARLVFRFRDDPSFGTSSLSLVRQADGSFVGSGPYLTSRGLWDIGAEVRRANADDLNATFPVQPHVTPQLELVRGGPWSNPGTAASGAALLAIMVVGACAGVLLMLLLRRGPRSMPAIAVAAGAAAMAAGLAVFVAGPRPTVFRAQAATVTLAGLGGRGEIRITGAYAVSDGANAALVYMVIANSGGDEVITEAKSLVAPFTPLMVPANAGIADGSLSVAPSVPLPAGATLELKPGGPAIRLVRLNRPLEPGTTIDVDLSFRQGRSVRIEVAVR